MTPNPKVQNVTQNNHKDSKGKATRGYDAS